MTRAYRGRRSSIPGPAGRERSTASRSGTAAASRLLVLWKASGVRNRIPPGLPPQSPRTGTGAGFPSVPLKIFRDDIKLTLLDSLAKRINFLEKLCDLLEIEAEAVHGRAEDIAKMPEYREKFDFSCARAVANLSTLSEYCIPFVKKNGSFISMKGPNEDVKSAENSIKILGGEIASDIEYEVESDKRRIITIKKISHTPPKYPRNSGQIKKKPL